MNPTRPISPTRDSDPAAASPKARTRLVIYTALVGPKEPLNNPLEILPEGASSDLDLEFVCITDNPDLQSPVWRFVLLPSAHLPPEKLSRRPKAMPAAYFPEADYSLYIDNTVAFKRLPQASDLLTDRPYLFRAFKHARHSHLDQEAFAIASLGYEDAGIVCGQLDFYASRAPLAEITPLTTATVLLRSHHHPSVKRFGEVWWENILAFAKRDQLSFDFALRQSGCEVDHLPGITRDNEFIRWQGSLSPSRLRASFDARRYAWAHRAEPGAASDPKAHALAHGRGSEACYQRPLGVLELLCFQQRSSLGAMVSPRRDMAGTLDALLAPLRQTGCRFVIVRLQDSGVPQAFSAEEFDTAGRALAIYLGAGAQGTVLDLGPAELAETSRVYSSGSNPPYDMALALGIPGDQLLNVVQKLARLLKPDRATLALALTSPAPLAQAAQAEAVLAKVTGSPLQTLLQASRHDDLPGLVPNTVVGYGWPGLAQAHAGLPGH